MLHPQTQGKIERWHRSMKNVVKLENYYLPGDLINRLEEFVDYYNNRRYHESINNLTPADVYYGRGETILQQREIIKQKTMKIQDVIFDPFRLDNYFKRYESYKGNAFPRESTFVEDHLVKEEEVSALWSFDGKFMVYLYEFEYE